jgi:hypothetical protein
MWEVRTVHDQDLRQALHEQLGPADAGQFIIDELGLCGEVRVDVATVTDTLNGYELKSDTDTLQRLPKQVEWYSKCLDHCTLVVADRHLDAAARLLPDWWGIVVVREDDDAVRLDQLRPTERNTAVDPFFLAQLLWKPEVTRALEERDAIRGYRSKSRMHMWRRLTEVADVDEIRGIVRTAMTSRKVWRKPQGPPRATTRR